MGKANIETELVEQCIGYVRAALSKLICAAELEKQLFGCGECLAELEVYAEGIQMTADRMESRRNRRLNVITQ